jgi:SAM-dependent methyltransferase
MFGNAEAYERFMGRWSRLLAPQFVDFSDVPDRGRVLDVGSGTGSLAFAIAERKARSQVVGIDPSKEYVAYANSRNPFPDWVSFEVGDAQQVRFADASFEASLSLLVFNFIPDPAKALREVRRVTKPGGRISAAVWDYGDGMRMLRAFWDGAVSIDTKGEKVDEKHMPLCRAGELSELWRNGGLENVREQPLVITMRFEYFADYWDAFLLGQGPAGVYVRSLTRDQLHALRGEVKSRVSRSVENMPIALAARVWSVCGTVPTHP